MTGFQGFPPRPNLTGYTAVPNVFFDEVLPNINNMSELKILLAVFRKTYGWVKEIDQATGQPIYKLEDEISYSQFEQLTGLSSTSIATGLTRAQNDGFLEKVQQGNYSGTTSAYRVVTNDGSQIVVQPQPNIPQHAPTNEPKTAPIQYLPMDDSEVAVPKSVGTPMASLIETNPSGQVDKTYNQALSPEKKDILGEIFGSTPTTKSEPKEKKSTPHQEFMKCWLRLYRTTLNVPYGNFTGKEHGHVKSLLKEYDLPTLIKAMEFYFKHYKEIDFLPSDHPKLAIFYGYRKSIIPASQHGLVNKPNNKTQKPNQRTTREFDPNKFDEGDDYFD